MPAPEAPGAPRPRRQATSALAARRRRGRCAARPRREALYSPCARRVRPTTASTAAVEVHDLAGDDASEVQRKQWASAAVKGRGRSTSAGSPIPRPSRFGQSRGPRARRTFGSAPRDELHADVRGGAPITSPSDPWDASAASQVPGREPRRTCETTRRSRVAFISNSAPNPAPGQALRPCRSKTRKSARCPIECPNSAELVASEKKKIPLECGIANGETRTRTGDTTIFSRGPESL
jgi:hypothetical protein